MYSVHVCVLPHMQRLCYGIRGMQQYADFYMGAGNSDSHPRICVSGTLRTDQLPNSQNLIIYVNKGKYISKFAFVHNKS